MTNNKRTIFVRSLLLSKHLKYTNTIHFICKTTIKYLHIKCVELLKKINSIRMKKPPINNIQNQRKASVNTYIYDVSYDSFPVKTSCTVIGCMARATASETGSAGHISTILGSMANDGCSSLHEVEIRQLYASIYSKMVPGSIVLFVGGLADLEL